MSNFRKEDLDKRICDVVENAENTQTWREFIKQGYIDIFDDNSIADEEINGWTEEFTIEVIEELDWLYEK